jgi:LysR family glycine cleavage system transcriptional activator
LRSLEVHLDVSLLDRSSRALALTPEGEQLATALNNGFGTIHDTISQITGAQADRPLHISTTPTFAASWLMPRLPKFREKHPEIDLMLDPTPKLVSLSADGIDAAIRYGDGVWPGVESSLLVRSPLVVVAAPALVGPTQKCDLAALERLPWLEEFGRSEADVWLAAHGLDRDRRKGITRVPGNLLLDGARDGQGVAVTVRVFVEADIAAGRLCVLFEEGEADGGYHLITRPGVMRPVLKSFATWLRREAKG